MDFHFKKVCVIVSLFPWISLEPVLKSVGPPSLSNLPIKTGAWMLVCSLGSEPFQREAEERC